MEHHPIRRILGIDFETASHARSSACSVGLCLKEFGADVCLFEKEILINPHCEFEPFNMLVNGITPEMVADAPTFPEVLPLITELIDNETIVVAHNASFDMSVIRRACEANGIEYPSFAYFCTLMLSRALIPHMVSYSLPFVVDALNLEGFKHHRASDDAKACAGVFESFARSCDASTLEQLEHKSGVCCGSLLPDQYYSCSRYHDARCSVDVSEDDWNLLCHSDKPVNESNPFFQKTVVFTGALSGMTRKQAEALIQRMGGLAGKGVTKETHYLVHGYQDPYFLKGHEKSSKFMKAEQYASAGTEIQIVCETDFYKMIELDI